MPEISDARYRAGSGEPMVLIHGFTATWRCWQPVLADLVARFDVLAPTLTGHHGGPEQPHDTPHTLAAATDHVEAQLDEQGIDTAHLVGNSLGGALALELAKRGRARSVVALAPGGGWHHGDPEGERIIRFFRRQQRIARASASRLPVLLRRPGARRLAFRDVMVCGHMVQPADGVEMVRSSLECTVVDDVYDAIRSGNGLLRDLDQVKGPVLVAWPERDRVLPMARHAQRFREEIPGVEFRVLKGLGHVPMWDDPRLVAGTIAEFAQAASARPVAQSVSA